MKLRITNALPLFGRRLPLFGRRLPPYGRRLPPFGRRLPPFGRRLPLFGRRLPPYGRRLPLFGRRLPLFGRSLPIFGRSLPSRRRLEPAPRGGEGLGAVITPAVFLFRPACIALTAKLPLTCKILCLSRYFTRSAQRGIHRLRSAPPGMTAWWRRSLFIPATPALQDGRHW
jgi:hypothetical protein